MKTLSGFIVLGFMLCGYCALALASSSTTTQSFTITVRIPPAASLPIFPQSSAISASTYQKTAQENSPAIITEEKRILPDMSKAVFKSISIL